MGRGIAERVKDQWDGRPDLDGWTFVLFTTHSSPESVTRLNRPPSQVFFYIHCPFRLPASRVQVAVISQPFIYNGPVDLNVRGRLLKSGEETVHSRLEHSYFLSLNHWFSTLATQKNHRSIPNNRNPWLLPQINGKSQKMEPGICIF